MTKHDRGTHIGYLEYHVDVLSDEYAELVTDLDSIRSSYDGRPKEQLEAEQKRLLKFRGVVKDRLEKIEGQLDGVKAHETEVATERAEDIRESAYFVHQEDDLETIPHNTGFKTATEWSQ